MIARLALVAAMLFAAGSALAQAPSTSAPPKPATQHQPGTPAHPSQPAAQNPAVPSASSDVTPGQEEKIDAEKQTAITHLMELTQQSKLGQGVSDFVTNQVRSAADRTLQPERVPKFMESFSQKFAASNVPSSVTDATVHIYARNFSSEEIHGLIQFYESPLGQRVLKVFPNVERDSQAAGLEIGRSAAISILNGMTTEYPEIAALLHPPAPPKPATAPAPPAAGSTPAPKAAPQTPSAPVPAAPPAQK